MPADKRITVAIRFLLGLVLAFVAIASTLLAQNPRPSSSLKLYVFDCGTIAPMNPQLYNLKAEEISGKADSSRLVI